MSTRPDPANDLRKLLHEAIRGVTDMVERSHDQVAGHVVQAAGALGVGTQAEVIDTLRRAITTASLLGVRGVNATVEVLGDAGFSTLRQVLGLGPAEGDASRPLPPLRSDALARPDGLADAALGVLNGAFGDGLAQRSHGLDLGMHLRLGVAGPASATLLPTDPAALQQALATVLAGEAASDAKAGVVVLLHGLAITEWGYCFGAAEHWGDPAVHFGALLERELGLLPVYVRYNSGRAIADNGAALAERLDALHQALVDIEHAPKRICIVGHSMGGLVVRDALARAIEAKAAWLPALDAVACLGSPHHGAPLERVAAGLTATLSRIPLPGAAIPAALLSLRSAGIRDLAHGDGARHISEAPRDGEEDLDDGWQAGDGEDVDTHDEGLEASTEAKERPWRQRRWPELAHTRWLLIAGTVTPAVAQAPSAARASHSVLGDGMVSIRSARADGWPDIAVERHTVPGVNHAQLPNHPDVYAFLRRFLAADASAAADAKDPT